MSIQYHSVQAMNDVGQGAGQTEFNTLSFELMADGRELVPGSLRIDFEVQMNETGTTRIAAADNIFYDPKIGGHTFFSEFQTSVMSLGQIESISEYPRWVSTHFTATQDPTSVFNAKYLAEGRQVHARATCSRLQQTCPDSNEGAGAVNLSDPSYSIAPLILFNRTVGASYDFSSSGPIRIDANCQRNGMSVYGAKVDAATNYKLVNVRLRFSSRASSGSQGKMLANSVVNVKSTVQSASSSVDVRVPAKMCSGVVINFLKTAEESDFVSNNNALVQFPQLDRLRFSFNDALNTFYSYTLDSRSDYVKKAIEALNDNGMTSADASRVYANSGYIIGSNFESVLDLSQNKFKVELQSSATTLNQTVNQLNMYMYFLTQVVLFA